jgi:hypothetical protein
VARLRQRLRQVEVEDVARETRDAPVVGSAVHEEQRAQGAELAEGEVRAVDGLPTLLADDAHADVRLCGQRA